MKLKPSKDYRRESDSEIRFLASLHERVSLIERILRAVGYALLITILGLGSAFIGSFFFKG